MHRLRQYQKDDIEKLKQFKTVAILNRPRTGKTPTSLILSNQWPQGKTLIVCTGSMLYKWQEEFKTWLNQPCVVYAGTPKQRQAALDNWTHGLVVTYDTLKLIDRFQTIKDEEGSVIRKLYTHTTGALHDILAKNPIKLIVDEFHRAKGHNTARAKALNQLAKHIEYRAALTGTPAYSTQLDVYSLLHFLWPSEFKNWWSFKQKYITHSTVWVRSPKTGVPEAKQVPVNLNPVGLRLTQTLLSKYAVQRKVSDPDVMPWVPKEPIPEIIKLNCSKEQTKALKELSEWFETENEEVVARNALDRLTKYRQIISEPQILLPVKKLGPKSQWILDAMKEYTETPTIFFTNSTKHIKLLLPHMNLIAPTKHIIGETPLEERTQIAADFQAGKFKHLICNTQAAQEGLTLDTAEWTVLIEQFPPIGAIEQALARFTPATIDKADVPKRVTKLIMRDTYDEHIENVIKERNKEVNVINDFKQYIKRR